MCISVGVKMIVAAVASIFISDKAKENQIFYTKKEVFLSFLFVV